MEDLYGDLENYNDVNELDELRCENKDLKFKLQEHTSTIEKLQKDYDKVMSECQRLQINFSSLLKTARAEIVRKNHIINNLNLEKDMMVLNALKNSDNSILTLRNMARDRPNNFKKNRRDIVSDCGKITKDSQEIKKLEPEKERCEENRLRSIDTISSGNTDDTNKLSNIQPGRQATYKEKSSESKENIVKVKPHALSIRNRRKSMPVSKQLAKFSSDEEFENEYSSDVKDRREDKNRRVADRPYNRQSHKISETSGIDEKFSSYHESSRETYYKGKYKYSDKYKSSRERYDYPQRNRKLLSPERFHRREPREFLDEHHQRPAYGRRRMLESPPLDRDVRRRNRSREYRSNYDKEHTNGDRNTYHTDKPIIKHKIQSDCEEPANKRARTDSSNRHMQEDRRLHQEKELESKKVEEPVKMNPLEYLMHISCQSPDYIYSDTDGIAPVKEIMDSEATQQEDPRLVSKKYTTKTENDKVVLSTVVGRNVDLIVINKSRWNVPQVDVPKALQKPPQQKDLIQQLYMDIDNPVSNMSLESGEVYSDGYSPPRDDAVTKSFLDDYENEARYLSDVRGHMINFQEREQEIPMEPAKAIISNTSEIFERQSENFTNYRKNAEDITQRVDIPEAQLKSRVDVENPIKQIKCKIPNTNKTDKVTAPQSGISGTTVEDPPAMNSTSNFAGISSNKDEARDQSENVKTARQSTFREVIEGDLELSDETCDNTEINIQDIAFKNKAPVLNRVEKPVSQEIRDQVEFVTQITHENDDKVDEDCSNTCKNVSDNHTEQLSNNQSEEPIIDTDKKHKSKKKSQKNKGKETLECVKKDSTAVKKTRSKKETKPVEIKTKETKPVEIKTKFTDLFGDSNSLITPEDLGVIAAQTEPRYSSSIYLPIFEDAQDAIGVNVGTDTKIQKSRSPAKLCISPAVEEAKIDDKQEGKRKSKSSKLKNSTDTKNYKPKKNPKEKLLSECTNEKPVSIEDTQKPPASVCTTGISNLVNLETATKDPEGVNTIIISTGVQPRLTPDIETPAQANKNLLDIENNQKRSDILATVRHVPMALATSTPCKDLRCVQFETDTKLPDCSSNSSDSKVALSNNGSSQCHQSNTNAFIHQNEPDEPDVRIIVRRRRKIVKKT